MSAAGVTKNFLITQAVPTNMRSTFKNYLLCTGTGLHPELMMPTFFNVPIGSLTYTSLDPAYSASSSLHWFRFDVATGALQSAYTVANSNCAGQSMQSLVTLGLAAD